MKACWEAGKLLRTDLHIGGGGGGGGWVHIILWFYVCPSICFKPTQFQGEISPRFLFH